MRLATEELPDTRSEAALALRSRGQVLGALTVQSDQLGAFDEQTVAVLQTMADQVAVAIDNARLYDESRTALEAERRAYGAQSRAAWAEHLRVRPNVGYYCDGNVVTPVSEPDQAPDSEESPAFSVPIKLRGDVIGVLDTHKPADTGEWTADDLTTLETLAQQVGQALEGARLYQDTQRRAVREQLTGHIADKMRRAADMESLMQTTIEEVASALGASSAFVQVGVGLGTGGNGSDIGGQLDGSVTGGNGSDVGGQPDGSVEETFEE